MFFYYCILPLNILISVIGLIVLIFLIHKDTTPEQMQKKINELNARMQAHVIETDKKARIKNRNVNKLLRLARRKSRLEKRLKKRREQNEIE